jgi:hypothetical protein
MLELPKILMFQKLNIPVFVWKSDYLSLIFVKIGIFPETSEFQLIILNGN